MHFLKIFLKKFVKTILFTYTTTDMGGTSVVQLPSLLKWGESMLACEMLVGKWW